MVHFCLIFGIENGKKISNTFGILCFFTLSSNAIQMICTLYGEGVVNDGMYQKWFAYLRFSSHDASWLTEIDSNEIKTCE